MEKYVPPELQQLLWLPPARAGVEISLFFQNTDQLKNVSSLPLLISDFQGLLPLPSGPARMFYTEDTGEEDPTKRFFKQLNESHSNRALTWESVATQYLVNVRHSDCQMAMGEMFAGPGQAVFGASGKRRVDLCLLGKEDGNLLVYQVHEERHVDYGHKPECQLFDGEHVKLNAETRHCDDFNRGLAEALTSTGLVRVEYRTLLPCDVMHGNPLPEPNLGSPSTIFELQEAVLNWCKSLRSESHLDQQGPHVDLNYVGTPDWLPADVNISEAELLEKILDESSGSGGFVIIRGGREESTDMASKVTGFCLQKGIVSPRELGEGNMFLAEQRVRKSTQRRKNDTDELYEQRVKDRAYAYLDKKCESRYTLLRRHFDQEICLPVHQFRWLYNSRKLRGFSLVHYVHYEMRTHIKSFLYKMLADRWNLKQRGLGNTLGSTILKLICNGYYGYTLINHGTFPQSHVLTDNSLRKKGLPKDITELTLLGVIRKGNRGLGDEAQESGRPVQPTKKISLLPTKSDVRKADERRIRAELRGAGPGPSAGPENDEEMVAKVLASENWDDDWAMNDTESSEGESDEGEGSTASSEMKTPDESADETDDDDGDGEEEEEEEEAESDAEAVEELEEEEEEEEEDEEEEESAPRAGFA